VTVVAAMQRVERAVEPEAVRGDVLLRECLGEEPRAHG